jgi:two-component system, cell cycle sensor histidine kinase and response regulator CckA
VNGRDAMPEGGVLRIETGPAPDAGGFTRIVVADTGVGMDEETAELIFEPFFTTKPFGAGTGLGLSTVYGILSQAGGTIDVRTAPGEGATFELLLPALASPPADGAEAESPTELTGLDEPDPSATVLVVEDEPAVLTLVKKVLERAGYRVLAAENGEAALKRLQETDAGPDLLLTDVRMPGMDGPTLAGVVRRRVPGCAVVFMSGYAEQELPMGELGADSFIEKPFTPALLLDRVRRAVRAARSGDATVA